MVIYATTSRAAFSETVRAHEDRTVTSRSSSHQLVFPAQLQSEQMACPTVGVLGEPPEMGERGEVSTQKHRRRAGAEIQALVSVILCWKCLPGSLGVIVSEFAVVALLLFFFCLKFGSVVCFLCKDAYQRCILNFRVSPFCPLNARPARDTPGPESLVPASASYSLNQGSMG